MLINHDVNTSMEYFNGVVKEEGFFILKCKTSAYTVLGIHMISGPFDILELTFAFI